jgi:3-carboxy-cis,cis-muconate cycloisomerase
MKRNLELTDGLIYAEAVSMALSERMACAEAHEIVRAACAKALREKRNLRAVLSGDSGITGHLSAADLDRLFDPRKYLGAAEEYVQRVVAASRSAISGRED